MLDAHSYQGYVTFQGQTFPVTATLGFGWTIDGSFESGGTSFGFGATLEDDVLTFRTGGTSYRLVKVEP